MCACTKLDVLFVCLSHLPKLDPKVTLLPLNLPILLSCTLVKVRVRVHRCVYLFLSVFGQCNSMRRCLGICILSPYSVTNKLISSIQARTLTHVERKCNASVACFRLLPPVSFNRFGACYLSFFFSCVANFQLNH